MQRMEQTEQSLEQQFNFCEGIINDVLKDGLGDSKSAQRNEKLKSCIQTLQSLTDVISRLSLFSTNEAAEELPTGSLRMLLLPAYLGCALQEIQVEMDKRKAHLNAAKLHYREYLQNLSMLDLINFKLPWLESEVTKEGGTVQLIDSYEEAKARRQRTIARIRQMEQLEQTMEQLRNERRRNKDEAAERELVFTLLRFWSIRAIKELDIIEEELKMVSQYETRVSHSSIADDATAGTSHSESFHIKPFILARSEAQKRVFGLGYPSVPTVTVDEWFDQMQKSGSFGRQKTPTQIVQRTKKENEEEDDEEEDEEKEENKRRDKIKRDEWKEMNPKGWGNTYNKG